MSYGGCSGQTKRRISRSKFIKVSGKVRAASHPLEAAQASHFWTGMGISVAQGSKMPCKLQPPGAGAALSWPTSGLIFAGPPQLYKGLRVPCICPKVFSDLANGNHAVKHQAEQQAVR